MSYNKYSHWGFLRVKPLKLDYTITNHHGVNNKPLCSDYLLMLVRLIRPVTNKNDDKLVDLLNSLRNNVNVEELKDNSIFRLKEDLKPTDFINRYHDLTKDPKYHSIANLMEISLNIAKVRFSQAEDSRHVFKNIMRLSGYDLSMDRISTHKSIYLIAHFTTADISSWSDFESVKQEFGILRKCFITLSNKKRYKGWRVFRYKFIITYWCKLGCYW